MNGSYGLKDFLLKPAQQLKLYEKPENYEEL
jgi:hypothetical protein